MVSDISRRWAPPVKMTVSAWADEYRFLSSESGAAAGKWHTLPFQREIFDSFSTPSVLVVMCATQLVKTVLIENTLGFIIDRDPGPTLLIVPRDLDGDRFSKIRLAPMVRDTQCLRDKVVDVKTARTTNTLDYKGFPGGHLTIAAAGSPGNLAALPIRYLLCDEIDKYPASSGSEGDPISLALKRTATFWNRKVVLCCSPTIDGESRIAKAFAGSDQREYTVPCRATPAASSRRSSGAKSSGTTAWPPRRRAQRRRFLDEALPGRSQTASQIAFYNNRREHQWGVSPRDREAVLAAFQARPFVMLKAA
jgi:phage terminase large subunit GpA-like protein